MAVLIRELADPRVNKTTVGRKASELLHLKHQNGEALWQNFLLDGTVLVKDTDNRGKGSYDSGASL